MSGSTFHLGLTLPDGTEPFPDRAVFEANWERLDDTVPVIECTTATLPSSPYPGQTIYETDSQALRVRDGFNAIWRRVGGIPVVATTASVTVPYTGQVIFDLSNLSLKRWSGAAWVRYPDDTVATSAQATAGSTTSTSYVNTLTGGTACGTAFVAPPSGGVMITNQLQLSASAGGGLFSLCTIRVCTGAVVGSGSAIVTASDANAVQVSQNTAGATGIRRTYVSGLTPFNSYNVQQWFKVIGVNTMNTSNKELYVENK